MSSRHQNFKRKCDTTTDVRPIFGWNKMDLQRTFDQRLRKIDQLKEFIELYGRKRENYAEIKSISGNSENVRRLQKECAQCISSFQSENRERIAELIVRIQRLQVQTLEVLAKLEDEKPKNSALMLPPPSAHTSILQGKENQLQTPIQKIHLPSSGDTSLMTFDDYMKSPFTLRRSKPISLQFTDFHQIISPSEFTKVPR